MTRDEIIQMALEASKYGESGWLYEMAQRSHIALKRFAALVAAAEREACANLFHQPHMEYFGQEIQDAIRNRTGQKGENL